MTKRTTKPTTKPTDNGREIPGIDQWARPAVLLHLEPGTALESESHLGGPLLWPIDDLWPHCDGTKHYNVTGAENVPFAGGLQLYRRDFPELPFPADADVLQVFLCLLDHDGSYGPDVRLVWRDSAQVAELLPEEPWPEVIDPNYEFEPCVFRPRRFVEYPELCELPEALVDSFSFAQEEGFNRYNTGQGGWPLVHRGTKIGGWTNWSTSASARRTACPECGALRVQLLALASGDEPGWFFGDLGTLNVLVCPENARHPCEVRIE